MRGFNNDVFLLSKAVSVLAIVHVQDNEISNILHEILFVYKSTAKTLENFSNKTGYTRKKCLQS